MSPSWLGCTFPLKSSHGCAMSLSLWLSLFLSLWHTPFRALCVSKLLFILIYIHLHPFQPHWVRVHYCHPPQQSAPLNRGRHRWRVVMEGREGQVRTGSVVSCLVEGSCFRCSIYFKVKTIWICKCRCLFKLIIKLWYPKILTLVNTTSLCLPN